MTIQAARDGMTRLERIASDFDYGRAREYVQLVKDYLRAASVLSLPHPLSDATPGPEGDLADDLQDRLAGFLRARSHYAPSTQSICRSYLRQLQAFDEGLKPTQSLYEPLILLLERGGDFYDHHGAICIRDAAMVFYAT